MRAISHVNPLTYQVDALRALMLIGGSSDFGLGLDFTVLIALTAAMAALAAYMYPRMGY
jgi:ABC-2 type transport system permease protein